MPIACLKYCMEYSAYRQSRPFWNPDLRLRNSNLNFLHYACRILCEIYIFRFDLQYSQYILHSCISQVTLSFLHRLNQLLLFYRCFFVVQELFLPFLFILEQPVCEEQSLFCCFFLLTAIFFLFSLLVLSFWTAGRWRTVNVLLFSVTVLGLIYHSWSHHSKRLFGEEQSLFSTIQDSPLFLVSSSEKLVGE